MLFVSAFLFMHAKTNAQAPGLYINEVSQGPSGAKEYVELLVVGTPTCFSIPTLDLRGWYIDDNNGFHASGTGTGIAQGCIRFTQDPLWAAIPIGTIIVIHNDADVNSSVPANDLSMSDGNCRLIIPVSNCNLLEKHTSLPSTSIATYPSSGFSSCGSWTNISMANTDDSFQTINPSGALFHSVSWGNNTTSTIIYFAGTSAGMVARMTNASNNNIALQANWTRVAVAGNESPGLPNNPVNQAWICSMNNGCTPLVPISLNGTQVNASCTCTGSATVNATGGFTGCSSAYSYSWAPSGGNTANANGLCAGIYTVTVTDINGCNATRTVNITAAPSFTVSSVQTNTSCNGGSNGSATVTPTGGTGPFSYSWSPSGGNGSSASGLSAGTYTVTVTDALGCTGTVSVTITQPIAITASTSSSPALCNGGSTGSATVSATGGAGNYTYAWSPSGGNGSSAGNLSAQIYTVTVTDGNGCTTSATTSVTQPSAITLPGSHTNELCNGGNTASAWVNPSGGTGTYTYAWSSGGNAATENFLQVGNYTVTVTDANNCTASQTFAITEPPAISISTSSTASICNSSNGSVTANVSGGTGTYTYSWNPGNFNTASVNNLSAGNYSLTVSDQNGCTSTATVTVNSSGAPLVSLSSLTNVSCFGGNNGAATVAASGGTGTLTYAWMPAGGSSANAINLSAGTYTCTITDQNGCSATQTVSITEPAIITSSISNTNALCNGLANGTANVNASGGTGIFSYAWSPSGGNAANASGLGAGTYSCTITDSNGCTSSQSVSITEPAALSLNTTATDPSCANTCDGNLAVAVSGGTPGYTYSWSSGCNSANCANTCAGAYSILVTDLNGCADSAQLVLNSPAAISITSSFTNANCNLSNGSASANATGGAGTFTYSWLPSGSGQSINNLPSGTYTVIATDANGCSDSAAVIVPNLPGVVAGTGTLTDVSCFGLSDGSAIVTASGGNPVYAFNWLPNISTNDTANGIASGNYQVTVTDADGCTSTVTFSITQPAQLVPGLSTGTQSVCTGQNILLSANPSGGTPAYNLVWNPGNLNGNNFNINPTASGTYTLTVTDQSGCTASDSVSITVNPSPVVSFTQDMQSGCAPVCISFTDASTVISPSAIASWAWDFGDGNNSSQQQATHCYTAPGTYDVMLSVISSDGCTGSVTINSAVQVFNNPIAAFSSSPDPATIFSPEVFFTDQSVNAVSWNWDFGDVNQSSSFLQNPSFIYTEPICYEVELTVSSADGCMDSISQEVCLEPEVEFYAPNAFTPNGDGHNDLFFPLGEGIDWSSFHMLIFDRWGNLIYETYDINSPWNGKVKGSDEIAEVDVYVWKVDVRDIKSNMHYLVGHVSLVR